MGETQRTKPTPVPFKTTNIGTLSLKLGREPIEFRFPDTGNAAVLIKKIFSGQEYPLLKCPAFRPHTIVDIGANVGASAVYFAASYPDAKIYCYEPSPSNFRFLYDNVSPIRNILKFQYGLYDRDLKTQLYLGAAQCLQNSIYESIETRKEQETIELRKASTVFSENHISPSILKVDTEGCEVPILRDLALWLPQMDLIYLEYHSERDRLEIDRLLTPYFHLWHSTAILIHRGSLAYVSNKLINRYPELGKREIKC